MKRFFIAIIFCLSTSLTASSAFASELAIWDRLQGSAPKGYVLLLRHALAPGVGDPDNFKLDDCSTQRNLSAQGREDAKVIGQWIKRRDIKIAQVQSSRWCRAKESAQLLNLGKVNLNKNLDSLFQEADAANHIQTKLVRKQIQDYRQKSGLLILVGHFVNISALTGASVDSGEGVLVRADSKGRIVVVGRSPKP
jgi:phosphohistidine phosphatase SixA